MSRSVKKGPFVDDHLRRRLTVPLSRAPEK